MRLVFFCFTFGYGGFRLSRDICVSFDLFLLLHCSLLFVVDSLFVFASSAAGILLIVVFGVSASASASASASSVSIVVVGSVLVGVSFFILSR
jgi:hypothetical protein